jgi:hypothetical protein
MHAVTLVLCYSIAMHRSGPQPFREDADHQGRVDDMSSEHDSAPLGLGRQGPWPCASRGPTGRRGCGLGDLCASCSTQGPDEDIRVALEAEVHESKVIDLL